ncbi:hypothetical protein HCUR_00171 [Holospora curviuscula]|uniref:Uncharacterized protein n=2 Tax=Holospora curviuscula TaxID=1082868 RepID=A0A2S5REQ1_9PROT|nr:hypothetical protein HCUR_00171 [Holospora curviuscula]
MKKKIKFSHLCFLIGTGTAFYAFSVDAKPVKKKSKQNQQVQENLKSEIPFYNGEYGESIEVRNALAQLRNEFKDRITEADWSIICESIEISILPRVKDGQLLQLSRELQGAIRNVLETNPDRSSSDLVKYFKQNLADMVSKSLNSEVFFDKAQSQHQIFKPSTVNQTHRHQRLLQYMQNFLGFTKKFEDALEDFIRTTSNLEGNQDLTDEQMRDKVLENLPRILDNFLEQSESQQQTDQFQIPQQRVPQVNQGDTVSVQKNPRGKRLGNDVYGLLEKQYVSFFPLLEPQREILTQLGMPFTQQSTVRNDERKYYLEFSTPGMEKGLEEKIFYFEDNSGKNKEFKNDLMKTHYVNCKTLLIPQQDFLRSEGIEFKMNKIKFEGKDNYYLSFQKDSFSDPITKKVKQETS